MTIDEFEEEVAEQLRRFVAMYKKNSEAVPQQWPLTVPVEKTEFWLKMFWEFLGETKKNKN